MKRLSILAAIAATLIAIPVARADNSAQIPGTHCSVYAKTPSFAATGDLFANGYVSCAPGYNLAKQVDPVLQVAEWVGWGNVYDPGWNPFSFSDPYGLTYDHGCTPGSVYRLDVLGQVKSGSTVYGAEVISGNYQCS